MEGTRYTLGQIAQLGEDLYNREYAKRDTFFDEVHFIMMFAITIIKMLDDDFKEMKERNKANEGYSFVELSPGWCVTETLELKDGKVVPSRPFFDFSYDSLGSAIQRVDFSGDTTCGNQTYGDLIRTASKDRWKMKHLPKTSNVYWIVGADQIEFFHTNCAPKKVVVEYLPMLSSNDSDCTYPQTYSLAAITTVLQIMFGAKKETLVVDKSNNSNPNVLPATEVDPANIK